MIQIRIGSPGHLMAYISYEALKRCGDETRCNVNPLVSIAPVSGLIGTNIASAEEEIYAMG
ncbi:MAG: hypothetical protein NC517_00205 [Firmicutes bacterium]|nr:hypothetical protein [Bacillota bacterium]